MRQLIIVIAFLFPAFYSIKAQVAFPGNPSLRADEYKMLEISGFGRSDVSTFDNQYSGIKGNAFLTTDWVEGKTYNSSGNVNSAERYNIDLYSNKLYMKTADGIFDLSNAFEVKFILLFTEPGDTVHYKVFTKALPLTEAAGKYVQLICDGKLKVLKLLQKNMNEVATGAYSEKEKRFSEVTKYLLLTADGKTIEVKLNKKSFDKAITDSNKEKLDSFIKDQNISLNTEEGWKEVINYYNSI